MQVFMSSTYLLKCSSVSSTEILFALPLKLHAEQKIIDNAHSNKHIIFFIAFTSSIDLSTNPNYVCNPGKRFQILLLYIHSADSEGFRFRQVQAAHKRLSQTHRKFRQDKYTAYNRFMHTL